MGTEVADGEGVTVEGGSMMAMSGHMTITTTTHKRDSGGLLKAVKRVLAGESLFLNHFSPSGGSGEVWLAATRSAAFTADRLSVDWIVGETVTSRLRSRPAVPM